ncbi:MAG: hypothetical protein JWM27_3436 [Gemmatimonadetes bacterium]|nr:hypothetical protein [Gemmatimonadota bacterium]
MTPGDVEAAVRRGVEYLATVQLPTGEFPSYARAAASVESAGTLDGSPFVTTFALYALSLVPGAGTREMIARGVRFLLDEQEPPGLWRYWTKANPRPIDPDLDDTCCASFVLRWLEVPEFAGGNEAAILANRAPSGLFHTWLREGARNDVDSVVNANVLLYLGERPETAAACEILNQTLLRGMEERTYYYYLDPLALYYAVSRAWAHGAHGLERSRDTVVARTLARQRADGGFGDNDLLAGLALCTLCNFGLAGSPQVARGIRRLVDVQRPDGSWGDHLFYAGPEPPSPHAFWWSSPALAAALAVEALCKATAGG